MKMRKIVAVAVAVLMLCCIIPFAAMADSTSATIDFTDKANRTAYSTQQQVWEQNGITVTNDKASSTSNVGDYGGEGFPARFYKSSSLKIEYPGMTQIVVNCDDYKASYATDLVASVTGATATVNGTVVTITLASAADSFFIAELAAQVRVDSITVYTGDAPEIPDEPDEPEIPSEDPEADTELSIADAIALGLSKEHNAYTEGKYFVSGVITEVYNTQYGNMKLTDEAGNILTIYGTYSADGELRYDAMDVQPVAGDTVTIYGIVGQYRDVAQIKNGWIVAHTPAGGETPDEPDEPEVPAEDTLTIKEAIDLGLSMEHNTYTEDKYYVTGVITEVYNTQYGNMKLTDEAGNILTIYGTYSADGELRYDAMDVQPVAGDTVTIYGIVGQYRDAAQIKNGWIVAHTPAGGETPDEPDEPVVPDEDTLTIEEAIALGTSMDHNTYTEGKYNVTGVITEVYNTQYGNMKLTDEAGNILTIYGTYSADGELRYDAMDVQPVAGDTVTIYGIVGQYNGTPQIKNGWIVAHTPAGGETPDEPDEPVVPDEPSEPAAPSVDTAFKFGMAQGNLENKMFYLAGGMDGYYMATTEDINAAIDVYLEETEGGYYFYTMDNGSKLYINMVVSGTHVNGAYEAAASTVYTYDAESMTLIANVDGADYWFATRNDKTYTTMGPCKVDYEGFYGKFFTAGGAPVEPDSPDTGDNSVVYVTLAVVLMVLAAAAVVLTAKKRA